MTEEGNQNPTKGCLKVAEIILNGRERIRTAYGTKTKLGIADLIYRETGLKELEEGLYEKIDEAYNKGMNDGLAH